MINTKVPKGMLQDGAYMWIAATTAGLIGFLKEKGIPLKEFLTYFGERFEDSFGDLKDDPVEKVMQHLLMLEILPMGAQVISTKSTKNTAEVILTSLPPKDVLEKFGTTPRELLSGFGVTAKEFESIYDTFVPAMKAIGLTFKHATRDGNEVITLGRISKK
jgi:hypothetical protein